MTNELRPLILVVNHDEVARKEQCRALFLAGYTSLAAGSGVAAIELMQKLNFQFAGSLLVLPLPFMDPGEYLRLLFKKLPLAPCLLIGDLETDPKQLASLLQSGHCAQLPKHSALNTVVETLAQMLSRPLASPPAKGCG